MDKLVHELVHVRNARHLLADIEPLDPRSHLLAKVVERRAPESSALVMVYS